MKLVELNDNERGKIKKIECHGKIKKRLLEMGFMKGETIERKKCAPLADPIEFVIKNYHISLRRSEAEHIIIDKVS
ncbi:ferrous iron transport protein A [Candidatus Dependentiae bacterium]|nr:ferrous iron transport protein A [Candidatus Dependentiae bacterium]